MDINKALTVSDLINVLVETKAELYKMNANFKSIKDDIATLKFLLERKDLKDLEDEQKENKEPDFMDSIIKNLIGDMSPEDLLKLVNSKKGK